MNETLMKVARMHAECTQDATNLAIITAAAELAELHQFDLTIQGMIWLWGSKWDDEDLERWFNEYDVKNARKLYGESTLTDTLAKYVGFLNQTLQTIQQSNTDTQIAYLCILYGAMMNADGVPSDKSSNLVREKYVQMLEHTHTSVIRLYNVPQLNWKFKHKLMETIVRRYQDLMSRQALILYK